MAESGHMAHEDLCASLCTNFSQADDKPDGGCDIPHNCWCADGALNYQQWQAKHCEAASRG